MMRMDLDCFRKIISLYVADSISACRTNHISVTVLPHIAIKDAFIFLYCTWIQDRIGILRIGGKRQRMNIHFDIINRKESRFVIKHGSRPAPVRLKTFRFDYRTKPDYQQRLEQWVELLSNDIQNHWYSPEWNYFFPQNETGEYVVNRIEVGRLLYRRRERFKVEETYLIHFLCLLEQWSFLQNELVKVQKNARPATPTAPQPAPAPATAESNPNLLKGLSEKLLSCDQALAKLKLLLMAIDPQMNTSNGQHDQKRRWSHLYKAWLEDGFVRDNITDADFGHLIHSLLPTRSSKSVYSTLYRDKEKMGNSDFQIIVQLIRAHFQPVADLMKAHHG